jgi:hypothetical protein
MVVVSLKKMYINELSIVTLSSILTSCVSGRELCENADFSLAQKKSSTNVNLILRGKI